jgi:hypothetical protein
VIWYSQAGQDRWVVDTLGDRPGYFVDVGAYDGIQTSNTYALELAGWDGICIEASPAVAAACASNRRCHTVAKAALQGLDFDRYTVSLITVEHNLYADGPDHKEAIYDFLTGRGFDRVADNVPCLDPDPRYYLVPYEDWYMNSAFLVS